MRSTGVTSYRRIALQRHQSLKSRSVGKSHAKLQYVIRTAMPQSYILHDWRRAR